MRSILPSFAIAAFAILVFGSMSVSGQSAVNVRFKAGASSGTYTGSIKGDKYIDYVVSASVNQQMTVKLTRVSSEPPYFNVLKKGSTVAIADDAREVNEWTGDIPATGSYAIRVYMAKAGRLAGRTSNFRLSISIDNGPRSGGGGGVAIAGNKTVYYDCSGSRLRADFKDGQVPSVRIRFGTQDMTLPLEQSTTGAKYEIENTMFLVEGKMATLRSKVLDSECRETR